MFLLLFIRDTVRITEMSGSGAKLAPRNSSHATLRVGERLRDLRLLRMRVVRRTATQQGHFRELEIVAGATRSLTRSSRRQGVLLTHYTTVLQQIDVALTYLAHAHRVYDGVTEGVDKQEVVHVAVDLRQDVHPSVHHPGVDSHLRG